MKEAIERLIKGEDLSAGEMRGAIQMMMRGDAEPAAIGSFLTALAIKGETVEEVTAAAEVMRSLAQQVALASDQVMVDPVGTGGDGASLFNVSTASAIIASAAGVKIAKHGNIAASSASGSADVLREAGVVLELSPNQVRQSIERCGFGFMFAPAYHSAMRHVGPSRRAMGIRTVFNLLGPLSNPASVRHQVLGVFSKDWLRPMVEVAKALGSEHIICVHSQNGLDEFSVTAKNDVCELFPDGRIEQYTIDPHELGIAHASDEVLKVANAEESLALIAQVFREGTPAVAKDMLAFNTAAILRVAGKVTDWEEGLALANAVMEDGRATRQLAQIVAVSQALKDEDATE